MSLTLVKGMQSEIFVPITPPAVWTPVTKELKDMTIALATAAGVHHRDQERFNLAGDFTWRKVTDEMPSDELMVSHGGYDNGDVNKDINCMLPIDRIHELNIWEGDKIFFCLLEEECDFFSLMIVYDGQDQLISVSLNGKPFLW